MGFLEFLEWFAAPLLILDLLILGAAVMALVCVLFPPEDEEEDLD